MSMATDEHNPYAVNQRSEGKPRWRFHGGIPQAIVMFLMSGIVLGLIVWYCLVMALQLFSTLGYAAQGFDHVSAIPIAAVAGILFGLKAGFNTMFSRDNVDQPD